MDIKLVPIGPQTVVEGGMEHPPLGPVVMALPEGAALCHDAFSCTMITGIRPASGEKFVVIMSVAEIGGEAVGTLAQFDAAEARSFAASLIGAADECDGGMKGAH